MRSLLAIAVACTAACTGVVESGGADAGAGADTSSGEIEKVVVIDGPPVLPHVQKLANLVCGTLGACTMLTYAGHHPTAARAIDILVSDAYGKVPTDNNALGDAVAAFVLAHQDSGAVTYAIWRQRYNDGGGWDPMDDRGSITQNHYDHVHVSFDESL